MKVLKELVSLNFKKKEKDSPNENLFRGGKNIIGIELQLISTGLHQKLVPRCFSVIFPFPFIRMYKGLFEGKQNITVYGTDL